MFMAVASTPCGFAGL